MSIVFPASHQFKRDHLSRGLKLNTYARGQHWDERVEMARWWSDYLDQLKAGAEIIPMERAEAAR